jgi:hypothetical protein
MTSDYELNLSFQLLLVRARVQKRSKFRLSMKRQAELTVIGPFVQVHWSCSVRRRDFV